MWKRFSQRLCCPSCGDSVELVAFNVIACSLPEGHLSLAKEMGLLDDDFNQFVENGALLCRNCKFYYPVFRGLPILLSYATSVHEHFAL